MIPHEICVWLDERWYNALSRQLKRKDTTIEDELDAYLDEMLNQLPAPVYERISREIWEEDQRHREAEEASRRFSAFRITQDGRTDHLLAEGGASMDALNTAMRLRTYLLRKGNSSERFAQTIPAADHIALEVFQEYAGELRQNTGRIVSVLDIDLDRGEFSALDAQNGWEAYAIRDVSVAAWHANRKDRLDWDKRLDIFAGHLETRMLHRDVPEMEPPSELMM